MKDFPTNCLPDLPNLSSNLLGLWCRQCVRWEDCSPAKPKVCLGWSVGPAPGLRIVEDSLPSYDKVSAACLFLGTLSGSKQERKELLIILVTTGGRHTLAFLWRHFLPALGVSKWGDLTHAHTLGEMGHWLSPVVPCCVYSNLCANHWIWTHVNTFLCRLFQEYKMQTNRGRM